MAESAGLSWYDTGTIKVTQNSKEVTGTNTTWSSAGIKIGDILTIDDTKMYQIASVNSNTSLTLKKVYGEASGTNLNYSIIRNFAATVASELAAKVALLVNKYESYIDADLTKLTGPAADFAEQYKGTWATGRGYKVMDIVIHNGKVYISKAEHTSTSANAPGASGSQWLGLYQEVPVDAIGTLTTLTTNDKSSLLMR